MDKIVYYRRRRDRPPHVGYSQGRLLVSPESPGDFQAVRLREP
jgi:hypothetical protein